jgi:hypothetical protein
LRTFSTARKSIDDCVARNMDLSDPIPSRRHCHQGVGTKCKVERSEVKHDWLFAWHPCLCSKTRLDMANRNVMIESRERCDKNTLYRLEPDQLGLRSRDNHPERSSTGG